MILTTNQKTHFKQYIFSYDVQIILYAAVHVLLNKFIKIPKSTRVKRIHDSVDTTQLDQQIEK